jgi:hypothetical protein
MTNLLMGDKEPEELDLVRELWFLERSANRR